MAEEQYQITFKLDDTLHEKLLDVAARSNPKRSKHQAARDLVAQALAGAGNSQDTLVDEIRELREVVSALRIDRPAVAGADQTATAVQRLHEDLLTAVTYILRRLHPEREAGTVKAWVDENLSSPRRKG